MIIKNNAILCQKTVKLAKNCDYNIGPRSRTF
jgi:hypothetical protein